MKIASATTGCSLSCSTQASVLSQASQSESRVHGSGGRTNLQGGEWAELLLTCCASTLEGPGVGDVVAQVVDLELWGDNDPHIPSEYLPDWLMGYSLCLL